MLQVKSDKNKIQRELTKIINRIVKSHRPDKIILFGSFAWGNPGPDSDVDLFIIKKTNNTRELARKIDGSLFPRPFPLDLIVYKPGQVKRRLAIGDFFIKDIMTKGRVLYAK